MAPSRCISRSATASLVRLVHVGHVGAAYAGHVWNQIRATQSQSIWMRNPWVRYGQHGLVNKWVVNRNKILLSMTCLYCYTRYIAYIVLVIASALLNHPTAGKYKNQGNNGQVYNYTGFWALDFPLMKSMKLFFLGQGVGRVRMICIYCFGLPT